MKIPCDSLHQLKHLQLRLHRLAIQIPRFRNVAEIPGDYLHDVMPFALKCSDSFPNMAAVAGRRTELHSGIGD